MAAATTTTTTTTSTSPNNNPTPPLPTSSSSSSSSSTSTSTSTSTLLKIRSLHQHPILPKRRRFKVTTITSSAEDPVPIPSIISPGSPNPVAHPMDFSLNNAHNPQQQDSGYPAAAVASGFTKFNSVLTAGLLNPHSPPTQARSSPTLFEMMSNEPDVHPRAGPGNGHVGVGQIPLGPGNGNGKQGGSVSVPVVDGTAEAMNRIRELLEERVDGFNDEETGDLRLHLKSKDGGVIVGVSVHREVLVQRSRFFAEKLMGNRRRGMVSSGGVVVEIEDCEDVEVYLETVRLMYCEDIRRRLMRDDVGRVLHILKVATSIGFDAGVLSCLEYLEAAPWAEDEEEKVASLLSSLNFDGGNAGEVLKRVSLEVAHGSDVLDNNDEVLLNLLKVVLEGKDEKARRDMKGLVSKMLHENSSHCDIKKESLYSACGGCLHLLRRHFLRAASSDLKDVSQIARQADNLHWLLDILIDRQIAEDFLTMWAAQTELSEAHPKVPAVHRFEISRVTARLFVGIGKGQLLASKDSRCSLLQTWLGPFYNDFGWMRRASKGLDRHLIEDSLSNTILTLPLSWQQDIMLTWFDRFLNSSDDCPNIQRGFEVWWRRAFWRRNGEQQTVPEVASNNSRHLTDQENNHLLHH